MFLSLAALAEVRDMPNNYVCWYSLYTHHQASPGDIISSVLPTSAPHGIRSLAELRGGMAEIHSPSAILPQQCGLLRLCQVVQIPVAAVCTQDLGVARW